MTKPVSVAVVGAGYWGKKLLAKFLLARDCSVKIVCDVHIENLADIKTTLPAILTTDSFEDVLRTPDIDAVVLATPPATHFLLARRSIEAGKHVWIEKPMAMAFKESQLLVDLAEAKEKVLFVDHTFLYDPAVRRIRDLIQRGELGRIHHIFFQRLNLGRIKRDSNVWWNSAPHDVSIALYLLPSEPVNIAVQGYRYLQPTLEDLSMAIMEMADGVSVFIYQNWLYPENVAKFTVIGSEKLLTYEGKFDKRELLLYEYTVERPSELASGKRPLSMIPAKIIAEHRMEDVGAAEPLVNAVSDFVESVRENRRPLSNGEFSLKVVAILEAGERSLRSGGKKIAIKPNAN